MALRQIPHALAVWALALGTLGAGLPAAAQDDTPSVAVFDFKIGTTVSKRIEVTQDDGTTESAKVAATRQTSLLTNKLITELTRTDEIAVVERKKMDKIMQEVSLTQSDLTNPDKAVEVGKLVGADYMVFGSINLWDPAVSVRELAYDAGHQKVMSMTVGATMRLVNTKTGKIKAAADMQAKNSSKQVNPSAMSRHIPQAFMDEAYDDLTDKLAQKIVNTLNPIKVAKQTGDTVYLARAGLEDGDRYEVVKLGEPIRDPDTGEILGRTSKKIAIIEVTNTIQDLSKAKVQKWLAEPRSIPPGSICRAI